MCNKCDCEAVRLIKERDELRDKLFNLLAIIHRDGGHYIMEHGIDKAVADAVTLSAERIHNNVTDYIPNTRGYNGPS